MGTVEENLAQWSQYDWPQGGDEWSSCWGGTEYLWWGVIFPRILAFVPTSNILEIAPGFGRCTHYLKGFCRQLNVVDLSDKCIKACKERFSSSSHIRYYVNDGQSLEMIEDNSIDFVFSWDSLVHAEKDVISAYLHNIAKKLKPEGVGFIHHSNIGQYKKALTGKLSVENVHWRATSMTATLFDKYCRDVGMQCISQEIIGWGGGILNDCFSLFLHKNSHYCRPNVVVEREDFMDEATRLSTIAKMYNPEKYIRAQGGGA